jgi:hypothetical protein
MFLRHEQETLYLPVLQSSFIFKRLPNFENDLKLKQILEALFMGSDIKNQICRWENGW